MAFTMQQTRFLAGQSLRIGQAVKQAVKQGRAFSVTTKAAIELKPLPYPADALESKGMNKETFEYHHGKHVATYVTNLNNQIKGTDLENLSLEEIVLKSWNGGKPTAEFNNAAQIWNHDFFFESMSPNGGGKPTGKLAEAIDKSFGSYDEFVNQFKTAGATQFGSGWAWLVADKAGNLKVTKTANAETPVTAGETPILTMDVWEHSYYILHRNRRPEYIANFVENLIDWSIVGKRFEEATA